MEWVFGAVIGVMLLLYIWAEATAKRKITPRVQSFVDDLFGSHPRKTDESKRRENSN